MSPRATLPAPLVACAPLAQAQTCPSTPIGFVVQFAAAGTPEKSSAIVASDIGKYASVTRAAGIELQ
jgi:hypothetical protein